MWWESMQPVSQPIDNKCSRETSAQPSMMYFCCCNGFAQTFIYLQRQYMMHISWLLPHAVAPISFMQTMSYLSFQFSVILAPLSSKLFIKPKCLFACIKGLSWPWVSWLAHSCMFLCHWKTLRGSFLFWTTVWTLTFDLSLTYTSLPWNLMMWCVLFLVSFYFYSY